MRNALMAAAAALLLTTACSGSDADQQLLWQSRWVLVEPALTSERGPIWFEADAEKRQIYGFSGCNRFFGGFAEGDELKLGPMGMTRMACAESMQTEMLVSKLLQDARGFSLDGERLTLTSGDGQTSVWQATAREPKAKP